MTDTTRPARDIKVGDVIVEPRSGVVGKVRDMELLDLPVIDFAEGKERTTAQLQIVHLLFEQPGRNWTALEADTPVHVLEVAQ